MDSQAIHMESSCQRKSAGRFRAPTANGSAPLPLLRRFWGDFIGRRRTTVVFAAILMVLSVLLQLPVPLLTMHIIDVVVGQQPFAIVNQLVLTLAALIVVRHVFTYINENVTLHLKESIIIDVQASLFRHLQSLPLSFFTDKHSAYLQSRIMNDSRAVEGALVRSFVTIAVNALTFVIGAAIILYLRPEVGLVLLLTVIPFGCIRFFTNKRMRALSTDMQERQAATSASISERVAGIATIKSFGQENGQTELVSRQLDQLKSIYIRTNWFGIASGIGTSLVTSLSTAFVLWYGLRQVTQGAMTLGQVVGILSLMNFLYAPVNALVAANIGIQQAASALQRIYEFLGEKPEQSPGGKLAIHEGRVEIRKIEFAYKAGSKVFSDFSLTIPGGETVALVGHSGAGKSSLVRLLSRLNDIQGGQILIDRSDIRHVALSELRAAVGIVEQQAFLFTGTILENIRLGRPDATLDEVITASRNAYAHDFISALPDSYEARVGERGLTLSGGECQRIALARMFLRDPKILVLDEAVSALDSQSEEYIQQSLQTLTRSRTTIIIAHRLSTLLLANRIVLIEKGVLVEEGTHEELISLQGGYARLFKQQFQSQIADIKEPVGMENI
ncbi:ABC transporter ATP-binding protein [Xanthomonas campestris]|uniref:ABC transporter ATP-binding protein n=1 Tax=Xanthomonas campestris TaxID=339 RepID=UPI001E5677CC|nr:ABC transporter ATP-binding protein [Xanthomonas campestris]